jgi:hypothetical protein
MDTSALEQERQLCIAPITYMQELKLVMCLERRSSSDESHLEAERDSGTLLREAV